MQTYIRKGNISTQSDISPDKRLKITTAKKYGGIQTIATCVTIQDMGGHAMELYRMGKDFNKQIDFIPCKRVTKKALEKAHVIAMGKAAAVMEDAKQYYKTL